MATQYQNPYARTQGYGGPNPGISGSDPRGRMQNQSQYQQRRFEQQQGPMASAMAYNYGRGSEANIGDYTDIMNQYRNIAAGGGSDGGGGGGGGFDASGMYTPFTVSYSDPFQSYGGFQEFSTTGGYSPQDIANMRARGVAPVRAAYANAQREVGRQRSLQGGYSPNAIATQARMARDQGQMAADAVQNVEAGLASERQKGRLAGLTGMSGIEGQRLGAQIDVGKFNAQQQEQAQARNIAAAASAAAGGAAASAQNTQDRLAALRGMTALYGTNPAMAATFGNQALQSVGQGSQFGLGLMGQENAAQQLPGAYQTTMGRIGQIANLAGNVANPMLDYFGSRRRPQTGSTSSYNPQGYTS